MTPTDRANAPRVLVVKLSSLGDIFHALPAVHNLKVELGATIDWAVQADYADLVRCFDDVDRVIPVSRRAFFANLPRLLATLRRERYDLTVDLQGLLKSATVARLARGRRKIGPSFHREGAWIFYSSVAGNRNRERHAVDENLDIVRHLRLPLLPPEFPMTFPPAALDAGHPRVALLPLSRWPSKNWPLDRFAALAERLQQESNATVFLLGSPADRAGCEQMAANLSSGRVVNLAGRTRLPELGGVLAEMDLVVTNDSGPMHLAAAVGVPTLAVFGPTDATRTGPYGEHHRVIASSIPCRPCFSRQCRRPDLPCLTGISVDDVLQAARTMLRACQGGTHSAQ